MSFRYSGITREMLASIDTRVEDVQRELGQLIPGDAILVGHSITNDLKALKVVRIHFVKCRLKLFPSRSFIPTSLTRV